MQNPWRCRSLIWVMWVSFMLHAFASVVCVFMLWVCTCMWDRCQGAVKFARQLQQRAEIKRFSWRLAPIVLYSDMCLWQCATKTHKHTPTRNHSTNPVDCNKYTYVLQNNHIHIFLCWFSSSLLLQLKLAPPALLSPLGVQVDTVIRLSGASPFYNWI